MRRTIFALALLVSLLASGCASVPDGDTLPEQQVLVPDTEGIESPLYENVSLEGSQTLRILDVNGEWALCAVEDWYRDAAGQVREQGFQYLTRELLIISYESGSIAVRFPWEGNRYCADGVLLQDHAVIYAAVDLDGGSPEPYQLTLQTGADNSIPLSLSGTCIAWDGLELARLSGREAVCSYWDRSKGVYGLSKVDLDGGIEPLLSNPITEADSFTATRLSHNGGNYLYLIEASAKETFVLGNTEGVQAQFDLPEHERLYDFCLCADGILCSSSTTDQDGRKSTDLIWRNLAGEELERSPKDPLQQMQAVGSCAFAQNPSGKIYAIAAGPSGIAAFFDSVELATAKNSAVSFFDTGLDTLLVHMQGPVPAVYVYGFQIQSIERAH